MQSWKKQIFFWLIWLIVWPPSLYIIYQSTAEKVHAAPWFDVFLFALLAIIVAMFPIMVNNIPVFFINGISLVTFLNFGLFIEILVTTMSVTVVLIKIKLSMRESFRIPMNYLMFFSMSAAAAAIYSWITIDLPGPNQFSSVANIAAVFTYSTTVFLVNHFLILAIGRFVYGKKEKLVDKSTFWEFLTTLYVLPAAILLHLLYNEIGVVAVLFIGFSIVTTSYILRLYYASRNVNDYLKQVSEVGHELTARLKVDETLDLFLKRLVTIVPVDYAYFYVVTSDQHLKLIRVHDPHGKSPYLIGKRVLRSEGIAGTVWETKTGVQFTKRKQWERQWGDQLPPNSESMICLPIERDRRVIGVLMILANRKTAYESYQFMLLNMLANSLAIALLNAKNYERTKEISERDPLTKLYNARYFDEYLKNYFANEDQKRPASMVLLDIDYFKTINDRFGHEAGNDVLQEIASRITEATGEAGIVARYGGEEFIIFLPGAEAEEAGKIAHLIKQNITGTPFMTTNYLAKEKEKFALQITASIGVSSYPENSADTIELVRHADRAMYNGAKQQGRNKVSIYQSNTSKQSV